MKKGFSIAEILISVIIIGFLFVITVLNIPNIAPDINKARFKKAYASLEYVVYDLLNNNSNIYTQSEGFKNTAQVIFKDTGETLGFDSTSAKFRDSVKYSLNIVKDNIDCELYQGMESSSGCFMTDDGTVWGIADTDFEQKGVVTKNSQKYTPIVMYTDYKDGQSAQENAFIIGIKYDGTIKILTTSNTVCKNNPTYLQCKAVEYLKSNTIKSSKE